MFKRKRETKGTQLEDANGCGDKMLTLLPKKLTKEDSSYTTVKDLDGVLSQAEEVNIRNIAVTGSFGSGKSSVLNTLIEDFRDNRSYLKISLATLEANDENAEKVNVSDTNVESTNRKIEYCILQQIIYREESSTVPNSRLRRITHLTQRQLCKYASWGVATVLALFIVFEPSFARVETLCDFFNLGKTANTIVDVICVVILLCVLFKVLLYIFRYYSNSKLNKLNLKDGEIEILDETSIFNKFLDEILYFFQVTDYNVVIIEDLDRFGTHEIFLKLRDLNHIINESKMIGRHITFVYAIKDDMFRNEDRTKFFDYITTTIPFVNPSNSQNVLKQLLNEKGCGADGICDDALCEIAFFIKDMRILKNIVNEYKQYREKLCIINKQELNKTKLLAMIVYKNYYPHDFSLLHSREGKVYSCLSGKETFMKEHISKNEKRIREIRGLEHNYLHSQIITEEELELLLLYQMRYNNKGLNIKQIKISDKFYDIEDIANSSKLFKNLYESQTIEYNSYNPNQGTTTKKFPNNIQQIADEMKFKEKVDQLKKESIAYEELVEERSKLQSAVKIAESDMHSLKLKDLISKYKLGDCKSYEDIGLSDMQDVFIKLGYLDEDYYDYISYFYEELLSESDRRLLLFIKRQKPQSFDSPISHIDNFVKELKPYMFKSDAILNSNILNYLVLKGDEQKENFELFMLSLIDSEKFEPFIVNYCRIDMPQDTVFKYIIERKGIGFWRIAINRSKLKDGNLLLEAYFKYNIELHEEQQNWINDNYWFLSENAEAIGIGRCKRIADTSMFISLNDTNVDLLSYVVDNNKYSLNSDNLLTIAHTLSPNGKSITASNLNLSRLFSIGKESVEEYVKSNIQDVVAFFKDENRDESKDAILYVINEENLPSNTKEAYLKGQHNKIDKIEDVVDENLYEATIKNNLISPNWHNVSIYFDHVKKQLTPELVEYLEKNAEELLGSECEENTPNINDMFTRFFASDKIDIEKYSLLIKSFPSIVFERINGFETIDKEHLCVLIKLGKIPFDKECLNVMNKTEALAEYILHYSTKFIDNIRSNGRFTYNVTQDVAMKLLQSKAFTAEDKREIVRIIPSSIKTKRELADILIQIYLGTSDICEEKGVLYELVRNAKNLNNKIKLATMMVRESKDTGEVMDVLGTLGKEYIDAIDGEEIEYSILNEKLLEALREKEVIYEYNFIAKGGKKFLKCGKETDNP